MKCETGKLLILSLTHTNSFLRLKLDFLTHLFQLRQTFPKLEKQYKFRSGRL